MSAAGYSAPQSKPLLQPQHVLSTQYNSAYESQSQTPANADDAQLIYRNGNCWTFLQCLLLFCFVMSALYAGLIIAFWGAEIDGAWENPNYKENRPYAILTIIALSIYCVFVLLLTILTFIRIILGRRSIPYSALTLEQRSEESGFEPWKFANVSPDTLIPMRYRSLSLMLYAIYVGTTTIVSLTSLPMTIPLIVTAVIVCGLLFFGGYDPRAPHPDHIVVEQQQQQQQQSHAYV